MVPFDVATSTHCVISHGRRVTHLSKGLKMLDLSVRHWWFCFADVEGITVPATGFVNDLRFLRVNEAIFARKTRQVSKCSEKSLTKLLLLRMCAVAYETPSKLYYLNRTKSRCHACCHYLHLISFKVRVFLLFVCMSIRNRLLIRSYDVCIHTVKAR